MVGQHVHAPLLDVPADRDGVGGEEADEAPQRGSLAPLDALALVGGGHGLDGLQDLEAAEAAVPLVDEVVEVQFRDDAVDDVGHRLAAETVPEGVEPGEDRQLADGIPFLQDVLDRGVLDQVGQLGVEQRGLPDEVVQDRQEEGHLPGGGVGTRLPAHLEPERAELGAHRVAVLLRAAEDGYVARTDGTGLLRILVDDRGDAVLPPHDVAHLGRHSLPQDVLRIREAVAPLLRLAGEVPVERVGDVGRQLRLAGRLQPHLVLGQDAVEDRDKGLVHEFHKVRVRAVGVREDTVSEPLLLPPGPMLDNGGDGRGERRVAAAEVVDRLLGVAHPEAPLPDDLRQGIEDADLGRIRVLELVHEDEVDGAGDVLPHLGHAEEADEHSLHVVEAHEVVLLLVRVEALPPLARYAVNAVHHVFLHLAVGIAGGGVGEHLPEQLQARCPAVLQGVHREGLRLLDDAPDILLPEIVFRNG